MRDLVSQFWQKASLNPFVLACFLVLGTVSFSVVQSGCTDSSTSQASETEVVAVASAVNKTPSASIVEESIESNLVTTIPPAELLKLLPLAKTTPVLLDFTSEYCGECKAIAPILAAAKKRYANKVTFMMIDVQKMMDAPEKNTGKDLMIAFRPMYTPTLIAIKPGGIVVAVESGFKTSPQIDAMLNGAIATAKIKTTKTA